VHRYVADKVQCVLERIEARDLVDIRAYHDVEPADAIAMRDELLALVRSEGGK
jgi:hypothetical protein